MENINKQKIVGIILYVIGMIAILFQVIGCFTTSWLKYETTLRQPRTFQTDLVTTYSVSIGLWSITVCKSVTGGFYLSQSSDECGSATIEDLNNAIDSSTDISASVKSEYRELLDSFTPQKILTVSGGVLGIFGFFLTYAYVRVNTKETRTSILVSGISCILAWLVSGVLVCIAVQIQHNKNVDFERKLLDVTAKTEVQKYVTAEVGNAASIVLSGVGGAFGILHALIVPFLMFCQLRLGWPHPASTGSNTQPI